MDFDWLLVPVGYLIGGFPTARLIGHLVGHDPTREGSGNPGATNMFRIAGTRAGIATLAIDVTKALIVTLVGRWIGGMPLGAFCGAAAVLGHMFPLPQPVRGGKGVASFSGLTIGAWPTLAPFGLAVWLLGAKASGRSFIGAMAATPTIAIGTMIIDRPTIETVIAWGLVAIIIARHHTNIRGLFSRSAG